jgi:F-type H+-transporting ATPase subunit b
MEKLGINLGFFLFQVFNFSVLAVLMYAFAYRPILKMLADRKNKIAQGLEDARVAAEARANAEKDAAKILSEAQANAAGVVKEATERAEKVAGEMKTAAEADLARQREAALAEAQVERERILGDLRGQVAALSIAAAQKLIGEALDEKRQHALINEFFSGVKAGKVAVLENAAISGASAEVTSAVTLTPEEKDVVKRDVLSKLGNQATVSFRVDPAILGGLVIKAGGKLLDASVSGQLEDLKQSLQ